MRDRQTEDVLDQRQSFADPTLSQAELQLEGEHGAPFGAQPFIPRSARQIVRGGIADSMVNITNRYDLLRGFFLGILGEVMEAPSLRWAEFLSKNFEFFGGKI